VHWVAFAGCAASSRGFAGRDGASMRPARSALGRTFGSGDTAAECLRSLAVNVKTGASFGATGPSAAPTCLFTHRHDSR
jgi:hypothetical protein